MSAGQASARAVATGKQVAIPAATSASSTLAANPDGTFTLTQTPQPVRRKVHGAWVDLDATLVRAADGSLTATSTTLPVRLSGGGNGPLATLTSQGHTLAVTAPMPLPTPTISGASATYPSVLPGVDLHVTADPQGGISTVLIIHNARAAADLALKTLTFTTRTTGLHLSVDTAGNLTATDTHHHPVFTAPAPTMWDSTTPPATTATSRDRLTGRTLTATGGHPVASTEHGPGTAARVRPVKVTTGPDRIRLTPDATLLTDPGTTWC